MEGCADSSLLPYGGTEPVLPRRHAPLLPSSSSPVQGQVLRDSETLSEALRKQAIVSTQNLSPLVWSQQGLPSARQTGRAKQGPTGSRRQQGSASRCWPG